MIDLIHKIFDQSPMFQGGLSLMVAGWLGYQLRELPGRLMDVALGVTTRVIQIRENHPNFDAWLLLLTSHSVRMGGPRTMEVRTKRCNDDENAPQLSFLAAGTGSFCARVLGTWCKVSVHPDGRSGQNLLSQRSMLTIELWMCSRAQLDRLVAHVAQLAVPPEDRQLVDLYTRHGGCSTIRIPRRDPRTLCLPQGAFELLDGRLREFCNSREQYERVGVPWRFGVLLSGPPGTGKTSLAHALASKLGLRLAVLPLADLQSDGELVDAFRAVTEQAIILIEDVDCAFRQRNAGGDAATGISFSAFLNCIDGVLTPHCGRILLMTTNHVDRLDPALIRPGRIDLHFELPLLDKQDASDFADRVFPNVATRHDVIERVMCSENPTPAALISQLTQERWRRVEGASGLQKSEYAEV